MIVDLVSIPYKNKKHLTEMMMDYFVEIDSSKIGKDKGLDYPYLEEYWTDESRMAYFITKDNRNVGFVLINDWVLNKEFAANYSIAEFYVKPNHRRKNIGSEAMKILWNRMPGKWEIRQLGGQKVAQHFWRKCIDHITNGNYKEIKIGNFIIQYFII